MPRYEVIVVSRGRSAASAQVGHRNLAQKEMGPPALSQTADTAAVTRTVDQADIPTTRTALNDIPYVIRTFLSFLRLPCLIYCERLFYL
jgi:hypothetical protein